MFQRLRKLFQSKPVPKVSHPIFGELLLNQGANGPYWLHEAFEDTGGVTISIETRVGELPTEQQVRFYQEITGDEQAMYERVRARLSAEHEKMHRKIVPSDWRLAFKLAGIGVPLDGDILNPWDIAYECLTDRTRFLYTCYFEDGVLSHVSVDT